MKLPQVNYNTQTQPLALADASIPARTFAMKNSIVQETANLANQVIHASVQHQFNTAKSDTIKEMEAWKANNDGVAFYDAKTLVDQGVDEKLIGNRETIPAYEVQPYLYAQKYNEVMKKQSENIMPSKYRDAYYSEMDTKFAAEYSDRIVKASKEQRQQMNAQIAVDIDELTLARQYDYAVKRVDDLQVPVSEKEAMVQKIRSSEEMGGYVDLVSFKDIAGARKALDFLHNNDSKNLDEPTQLKAINMLERFLGDVETETGLDKKHYAWLMNRYESIFKQGGNVDMEQFKKDYELSKSIGVEPRYLTEVSTAALANMQSNAIANKPADEQLAYSQQIALNAKGGDLEANHQAKQAESIIQANISYMNKDMLGYYHSKNGTIPTIDFARIASVPNLTASALAERKRKHDVAESRLKVSQGYLKDEEVSVLTDMLLNAKPAEVIAFTEEANLALGRDATVLYDQLRVKRPELGSLTVVGQLSAIGQKGAAAQVLRGHTFRKENPEVIQAVQVDYLPAIHEKIGGAYKGSGARYLSSIKNAVLDVYADKINQQGGVITDTIDSSVLEDSINVVTGGLIEHGDNMIEPPYYGATQATMDNWINNLNPEYIDQIGGVHQYASSTVVNKIRDAEFQLESVGYGRYVVKTENGGYLASKDGRSRFELKFDLSAPVIPQSYGVMMKERADPPLTNLNGVYDLPESQMLNAKKNYVSPLSIGN